VLLSAIEIRPLYSHIEYWADCLEGFLVNLPLVDLGVSGESIPASQFAVESREVD
jgi:hypothetical protein